ncbi:MAG: putative transposase [Pseudohongiellaceae bacterium]
MPNTPCHIIQRGNDRQACFFTKRDYIVYLDKLLEASLTHKVKIHSFVLMTNHVHLLCSPEEVTGVSRMLQGLGRYYVRYINSTYNRTGTLWEGRAKSSLVDSEAYLLKVSKYIELNPVRARMVNHPAEYPWSSYRHNAIGKIIKLVTSHPLYNALGKDSKERQVNYRALFKDNQIAGYTLEEIRSAANKSWVLGDGRFKSQIETQLGRKISPFKRGGDRKSKNYNPRP